LYSNHQINLNKRKGGVYDTAFSCFNTNQMFKRSLLLFLGVLAFMFTNAQTGVLKGKVTDKVLGEELTGVTITVNAGESMIQGTVTDLYGDYSIDIAPGTYTIEVSYMGMAPQSFPNTTIVADQEKVLNVQLEDNVEVLGEAEVKAEAIRNSEKAVLAMQKKSIVVQDIISSEGIKRLGTSNAGESMKQVTGASLEGGKFIVMRGLGDRYSITQMNGVTLPSTDPYRNSTSMDLIPAGMIENIVTSKTFTPDQPGNFTGGNVNISTKSFPEREIFSFGISTGYNSQSSFQKNFLTSQGGKYDWLGYDDGTRKLDPVYTEHKDKLNNAYYLQARNPNKPEDRAIFDRAAKGMRPESFVNSTKPTFMNTGFNATYGNRYKFGEKRKLGFIAGINYSHDFSYYENGTSNAWKILSGNAETLIDFFQLTDRKASENTNLGGLANVTYQWNDRNQIGFNLMYNHDGEKVSREQTGRAPQVLSNPDAVFFTSVNYMMERSLLNAMLNGKHSLGKNDMKLTWVGGVTSSSMKQPDMKLYAFKIDPGDSLGIIAPSEFDLPSIFFRDLQDVQYSGQVDLEVPLKKEGVREENQNKLKFGVAYSSKTRDFSELRFRVAMDGVSFDPSGKYYTPNAMTLRDAGTAERYFASSNFGIVDTYEENGEIKRYLHSNFIYDQTRPENLYSGTENIGAAYAMGVFNINTRLKTIAGVRLETTDILVLSDKTDADGNPIRGEIKGVDLLPSLNFIYALTAKSNLRLTGTQTLARPNMRELAPFAALDFIGGFVYEGSPDVKRTHITNADIRWELYPEPGEIIAVSGFFKNFKDPIIRVFDPLKPNPTIRFDNVESAQLYGLELEFRKSLKVISPALKNFKVTTNFTYIYSVSKINPQELAAARNNNPDFSATRPLQGQSPYIINAALTYDNDSAGFNATMSFNLFGTRLAQVGTLGTPDIYERPIPTLNLVVGQALGKHWDLSFKVQNILNSSYQLFQTYKDTKYITAEYKMGITTAIGISYKM